MTDFQVGDRVSVEGVVTSTQMDFDAMRETTMVQVKSGGEVELYCSDLTLIERPRRKLRVGSVWECGGMRFVVVDNDSLYRDDPDHEYFGVIPRSELNIDEKPHRWREVPVAELESEAT